MVLNMTDLPSMTGMLLPVQNYPGTMVPSQIMAIVLQLDVESIPTLLLHATTVV